MTMTPPSFGEPSYGSPIFAMRSAAYTGTTPSDEDDIRSPPTKNTTMHHDREYIYNQVNRTRRLIQRELSITELDKLQRQKREEVQLKSMEMSQLFVKETLKTAGANFAAGLSTTSDVGGLRRNVGAGISSTTVLDELEFLEEALATARQSLEWNCGAGIQPRLFNNHALFDSPPPSKTDNTSIILPNQHIHHSLTELVPSPDSDKFVLLFPENPLQEEEILDPPLMNICDLTTSHEDDGCGSNIADRDVMCMFKSPIANTKFVTSELYNNDELMDEIQGENHMDKKGKEQMDIDEVLYHHHHHYHQQQQQPIHQKKKISLKLKPRLTYVQGNVAEGEETSASTSRNSSRSNSSSSINDAFGSSHADHFDLNFQPLQEAEECGRFNNVCTTGLKISANNNNMDQARGVNNIGDGVRLLTLKPKRALFRKLSNSFMHLASSPTKGNLKSGGVGGVYTPSPNRRRTNSIPQGQVEMAKEAAARFGSLSQNGIASLVLLSPSQMPESNFRTPDMTRRKGWFLHRDRHHHNYQRQQSTVGLFLPGLLGSASEDDMTENHLHVTSTGSLLDCMKEALSPC